jgi:hypothetical protein
MTSILAAMQESLLIIESSKTGWKTHESLKETNPQCVTFEHRNPYCAYCGTFGHGLWKSDDLKTWNRIGTSDISSSYVTSISVSRLNASMYVGTEPSALYRSNDRGESWQKMSALNTLKSSTTWSFPPRPWTSHVRGGNWPQSSVSDTRLRKTEEVATMHKATNDVPHVK